jgi:hypothetical protein
MHFFIGMKHSLSLALFVVVLVITGCHSNGVSEEKKFCISKDECFAEKPDTCPRCGEPTVYPVAYGYFDTISSPDRYYLGTCEEEPYDPDWGCGNCDAHFWRKDRVTEDLEVISK